MATMVISEEAKSWADELVSSGVYQSVDEVIIAGLKRLTSDPNAGKATAGTTPRPGD